MIKNLDANFDNSVVDSEGDLITKEILNLADKWIINQYVSAIFAPTKYYKVINIENIKETSKKEEIKPISCTINGKYTL